MKTLDVVALIIDIPEKHLGRGNVGTIVETLAADVFEVEFLDLDGNVYATCAIPENKLMSLRHCPETLAA